MLQNAPCSHGGRNQGTGLRSREARAWRRHHPCLLCPTFSMEENTGKRRRRTGLDPAGVNTNDDEVWTLRSLLVGLEGLKSVSAM
jgi:hypothetical protein